MEADVPAGEVRHRGAQMRGDDEIALPALGRGTTGETPRMARPQITSGAGATAMYHQNSARITRWRPVTMRPPQSRCHHEDDARFARRLLTLDAKALAHRG